MVGGGEVRSERFKGWGLLLLIRWKGRHAEGAWGNAILERGTVHDFFPRLFLEFVAR